MKLLPLEIKALVGQEIRRVWAAAARMTEAPQEMLKKRAEWMIEHAVRTLDAAESLPTALSLFQQYWEQPQLIGLQRVDNRSDYR